MYKKNELKNWGGTISSVLSTQRIKRAKKNWSLSPVLSAILFPRTKQDDASVIFQTSRLLISQINANPTAKASHLFSPENK